MKLTALLIFPLLAACGNNNNNDSDGPAAAQLRITHASADAPAVNVYVDGELLLEEVDFAQTSGLIPVPGNSTLEVEVRGILPDKSEVTVIGPVDLTFASGRTHRRAGNQQPVQQLRCAHNRAKTAGSGVNRNGRH